MFRKVRDAKYGYFVTTASFTEKAISFSKNKNIFMIDNNVLKSLFLQAVYTEAFNVDIEDPVKFLSEKITSGI